MQIGNRLDKFLPSENGRSQRLAKRARNLGCQAFFHKSLITLLVSAEVTQNFLPTKPSGGDLLPHIVPITRPGILLGPLTHPGRRLWLAPAAPAPLPAPRFRGSIFDDAALSYLTVPYRFGGTGRDGIDCSGLVQQVFAKLGVELPRTAHQQYRLGVAVSRKALQVGDLLFFRTYAGFPSHVGIYLGRQLMLHASSRHRCVVLSNINLPYFRRHFIGARRILPAGTAPRLEPIAKGDTLQHSSVPSPEKGL